MTDLEIEDDFIDETEAAQLLRRAVRTLRLDRYNGEGPAYIKAGRTVLYRRSTVLAWLAAQERPAAELAHRAVSA
jgi:hypothetical protein